MQVFIFNTRFSIPLEEGIYNYFVDEENIEYFHGRDITYFSLKIYLEDNVDDEMNVFFDYSTKKPYNTFQCVLSIGFDDEIQQYDLDFIGRANPGEDNAYETVVFIDGLSDTYNEFHFVFRLDLLGTGDLEINVQLIESLNSSALITYLVLNKDNTV